MVRYSQIFNDIRQWETRIYSDKLKISYTYQFYARYGILTVLCCYVDVIDDGLTFQQASNLSSVVGAACHFETDVQNFLIIHSGFKVTQYPSFTSSRVFNGY